MYIHKNPLLKHHITLIPTKRGGKESMRRFLEFIGQVRERTYRLNLDTENIQYKMGELTIITLNINGLNSEDVFLD